MFDALHHMVYLCLFPPPKRYSLAPSGTWGAFLAFRRTLRFWIAMVTRVLLVLISRFSHQPRRQLEVCSRHMARTRTRRQCRVPDKTIRYVAQTIGASDARGNLSTLRR